MVNKYVILFFLVIPSVSAFSEFSLQGSVSNIDWSNPLLPLNLTILINQTDGNNIYTEYFQNAISPWNPNSLGSTFDVVVGRANHNLSLEYNHLYYLGIQINNATIYSNWTSNIGKINATDIYLNSIFLNISQVNITEDLDMQGYSIIDTNQSYVNINKNITVAGWIFMPYGLIYPTAILSINGTTIPTITNMFDLGTNLLRWKNGYFVGNITAEGICSSTGCLSEKMNISGGNFNGVVTFGDGAFKGGTTIDGGRVITQELITINISSLNATQINSNTSIIPTFNKTFDIGNSSVIWNEGHFKTLYQGENSLVCDQSGNCGNPNSNNTLYSMFMDNGTLYAMFANVSQIMNNQTINNTAKTALIGSTGIVYDPSTGSILATAINGSSSASNSNDTLILMFANNSYAANISQIMNNETLNNMIGIAIQPTNYSIMNNQTIANAIFNDTILRNDSSANLLTLGLGVNVIPKKPLHIYTSTTAPQMNLSTSSGTASFVVQDMAVGGKFVEMGRAGTSGTSIGYDSDGFFTIGTEINPGQSSLTNNVMRFTSDGLVGLGTVNPGAKFEVNGTINSTFGYFVNTSPVCTPQNGLCNTSNFTKWANYNASISYISLGFGYNVQTMSFFNDSAINWWRFDDLNSTNGIIDYFKRNNGTIANNFSGSGIINRSLLGNGFYTNGSTNGAKVVFPAQTSINFYTDNFSISMWIYRDRISANAGALIHKGSPITATGSGWEIRSGQVVTFYMGNLTNMVTSTPAINVHEWTHIVARGIWNGSDWNKTDVWINGIRASVASSNLQYANTSLNTSNDIEIAGRSSASSFNGTIDEVIIFNRSISQGEILALYNSSQYAIDKRNTSFDQTLNYTVYAQDVNASIISCQDSQCAATGGDLIVTNNTLTFADTVLFAKDFVMQSRIYSGDALSLIQGIAIDKSQTTGFQDIDYSKSAPEIKDQLSFSMLLKGEMQLIEIINRQDEEIKSLKESICQIDKTQPI